MSNVDEFYEYARNNFLNLLKKNNVNPPNEEKRNDTKQHKGSRDKEKNERYMSDMRKLKSDELNDKESYNKKYKNFVLKGKRKIFGRTMRKRSMSISSASSNSFTSSISSNSAASCVSHSSLESLDSSYDKRKKKRKHEKHKRCQRERDKKGRVKIEKGYENSKMKTEKKKAEKRKKKRSAETEERKGEKKCRKEKYVKVEELKRTKNKCTNARNNIGGEGTDESHEVCFSSSDVEKWEYRKEDKEKSFKFEYEDKMKVHILEKNIELSKKLDIIISEKKKKMLLKNALNKNLVDCKHCIDSNSFNKINKLNIISISDKSYMCYYNYRNIFLKDQLFISPIEHTTSVTNTNFETIQDMRNHMKSLIAMLEENNETCIFVEFNNCFNASIELISLRKTKHTYINCYIIPMELLEKAKIYFKKNMEDVNSLYRENKQLIITNNKYAPYNVIPKNIPYISVNFSLVETYIQVIENNYDYVNMCKCIFTDIFKKDKFYKYFQNFQQYVNSVESFKNLYQKYDWTNYIN
ncbi:debranching enzyme-associated ribonuclease [Plasmodium gonderi]|uniref:Debranching enzyme-associated ribonuclease n=1 Tax=Plasmodium gonderi TaxID=77519 RepID=A0A1Y1JM83_PLAGO|nr:debranching enzyme-associated ribonuclease [Plasmodium gonderi]GAW83581.1 debranching enzyme-associated ribonuclease [Plasmodium gonderi]